MSFGIQPIHLVVILLVALLVFGPSKLPEMSRNLGRAIAEFKRSSADFTSGFQDEIVAPINNAMNIAQTSNAGQAAPAQAAQPVQAASAPAQAQPAPLETVPSFPCSKCGTLNASDALFCKHCGNPFPLPTE